MNKTRIVHCDTCGSSYEVERILIGPHGTPIKCAHCGNVFSVVPEDRATLQSPVVWIVRDPQGNTTPFSRLGVLQRVILDGRAGPDWMLSRFGESWRPLGEIEGLKMFFDRAAR